MAKILVIDDDEGVLELVRRYLSRRGYEVEVTAKAQGAADLAAEVDPDLVVLDLNMPDMNGFEVAKLLAVRDMTQAIPVVFYSSSDAGQLAKTAASIPGARGVSKAEGVSVLHETIQDMLGEGAA